MANGPLYSLISHLRRSLETTGASTLTDFELLRRWLEQRDEAAFEVLLWRHGALVVGVCRRLLHNAQQVEDAFQATFLILVRKGSGLRRRSSLASWLYKIAYRVALRQRAADARRKDIDHTPVEPAARDEDDLIWRDVRPVLDEEIGQLPQRYRSAFILCYLEGKTNAEAAAELSCPVGTILSRLAWARERLRGRLSRRGVTLSSALLLTLLARAAEAATPGLVAGTLGLMASGMVPAAVGSLVKGVLQAMAWTRFKMLAVLLITCGILGTTGWLLYEARASSREPRRPPAAVDPSRPGPAERNLKNLVEVPGLRDGVLILVGTEIKEGEQVPNSQVIKVRIEGQERRYRRLREGDKVVEGQLLARLDDQLARDELQIAEAKIEAQKADVRASEKTMEEAKSRYDALTRAKAVSIRAGLEDEYRGAKLTWERYLEEVVSKKETLKVVQLQRKSAETIVRQYEIRSPVSGTLRAILKKRGEAVRALEPVFRIESADEEP